MGHERLLKVQVHDAYARMFERGYGRSRHADKAAGDTGGRIYSKSTFETYKKAGRAFASWMRESYPRVKRLDRCQAYVNEYLAKRLYVDKVSPHTFKTEKAALAKLFGVEAQDDRQRGWIASPEARRADVVRSRGDAVRDRHFSTERNADLVEFCRSTGLRRHELEALRGTKLRVAGEYVADGSGGRMRVPDGKVFLDGIAGKGGRVRYVEVVGDRELVVRMCREAGPGLVWPKVHGACDVHAYRADYAARVYGQYARPLEGLRHDEKYYCRGDKRGTVYDRAAMMAASRNLGHSRIDVVSKSYLR